MKRKYRCEYEFFPWNELESFFDPRYGPAFRLTRGSHRFSRHYFEPFRQNHWVKHNGW